MTRSKKPKNSRTVKVTEGSSGHAADFLLFSKRTATGPSCGKSIHPTFVLSVAVVLLVVSC